MPFDVPSLSETRQQARDFLAARLTGGALLGNSRARVLSDSNAGLAFEVFQFVATLAAEFLPDTASSVFLDRWATIYGMARQAATYAAGTVTASGIAGTVIPAGTQLIGSDAIYEVATETIMGSLATSVPVQAIDAGALGNLTTGTVLSFSSAISGIEGSATVVSLLGGVDAESDDSLRDRVLARIRKPPMGGDADDYVAWAREVPGVTRAWCSPGELGPGTVVVRFMMDELRSGAGGFPTDDDVAIVQAHIDMMRPVAADIFVTAPIPEPIDFTVTDLVQESPSTRAAIAESVKAMLDDRAAPARSAAGASIPAQTIYEAWVSEAILAAAGVDHFNLVMSDHVMPTKGSLAVLGTIS